MRCLLVSYLGASFALWWSTFAYSSIWGGLATLSGRAQRIPSYLNFSFAGGPADLVRSNFHYRVGDVGNPQLWLLVNIVKNDDGTYSLTHLYDADRKKIDRVTPIDGSYTYNEGTATLEYRDRDGSLIDVTISGIEPGPPPVMESKKLIVEGTVTSPDLQQVISFSDELRYSMISSIISEPR